MAVFCFRCGSQDFRQSRVRWKDLSKLLGMQYPVRCASCHSRRHAPLREAMQLQPAEGRRMNKKSGS